VRPQKQDREVERKEGSNQAGRDTNRLLPRPSAVAKDRIKKSAHCLETVTYAMQSAPLSKIPGYATAFRLSQDTS